MKSERIETIRSRFLQHVTGYVRAITQSLKAQEHEETLRVKNHHPKEEKVEYLRLILTMREFVVIPASHCELFQAIYRQPNFGSHHPKECRPDRLNVWAE